MDPLALFVVFLKASALSLGGLSSLPLLRADLVAPGIATDDQVVQAIAIGRISTGPNGLYIVSLGYLVGGAIGAAGHRADHRPRAPLALGDAGRGIGARRCAGDGGITCGDWNWDCERERHSISMATRIGSDRHGSHISRDSASRDRDRNWRCRGPRSRPLNRRCGRRG